jgi:hypothetical protein
VKVMLSTVLDTVALKSERIDFTELMFVEVVLSVR